MRTTRVNDSALAAPRHIVRRRIDTTRCICAPPGLPFSGLHTHPNGARKVSRKRFTPTIDFEARGAIHRLIPGAHYQSPASNSFCIRG
jgi:hypothetical protein